jgi:hypothetical protein
MLQLREFDESKHPRGAGGKWTDGGDYGGHGDTPEGYDEWRKDVADQWTALGGVNPEEDATFGDHSDDRPGVGAYAGSGGAVITNTALRTGVKLDAGMRKKVSDLTKEIADSPPLPETITALRGGKLSDAVLAQMVPGATFTDKGFVSTTIDAKIAGYHKKLAGIWGVAGTTTDVEYVLPKGSPVTLVKGSSEREIIVQRGQSFKVLEASPGKLKLELVL